MVKFPFWDVHNITCITILPFCYSCNANPTAPSTSQYGNYATYPLTQAVVGHLLSNFRIGTATINILFTSVKFPYWGVLHYADSLCIKISPIYYIANPNPNLTGPSTEIIPNKLQLRI